MSNVIHTHSHSHLKSDKKGVKLLLTLFLNLGITAVELVGGLISGSISLISDALHNFSDALSVIVSYVGIKISSRKRDQKRTFGYKRAEIFAAVINASTLVVISVYLFIEAVKRLFSPVLINAPLMIGIASIGLVLNTVSTLILHKDSKENINIKSTYFHLLSDALSSLAVIIGGVFIYYFKIYEVDPVLTIIIGIYILYQCYKILRVTLNVLLQGVPLGMDINEIKEELEKRFDEIENVHHIHLWSLSEDAIFFECHVSLKRDLRTSETGELIGKYKEFLKKEYNISHTTFQFEYNCCIAEEI